MSIVPVLNMTSGEEIMKPDDIKIEDVLQLPQRSQREMEQALDRIFDRLRSDADHLNETVSPGPTIRNRRHPLAVLVAAGFVIAAIVLGYKWQSRFGTLESIAGASHWVFQGEMFGKGGDC